MKVIRNKAGAVVLAFSRRELRERFSRAQIESKRDPEMREWLLRRRAMKPDGSLDWARIYEMEQLVREGKW
jgi:hypothetical protein